MNQNADTIRFGKSKEPFDAWPDVDP